MADTAPLNDMQQQIVVENISLAYWATHRYYRARAWIGMEFEDFLSEMTYVLMRVVRAWKPETGKLSTLYAKSVSYRVRQMLIGANRAMRRPDKKPTSINLRISDDEELGNFIPEKRQQLEDQVIDKIMIDDAVAKIKYESIRNVAIYILIGDMPDAVYAEQYGLNKRSVQQYKRLARNEIREKLEKAGYV